MSSVNELRLLVTEYLRFPWQCTSATG